MNDALTKTSTSNVTMVPSTWTLSSSARDALANVIKFAQMYDDGDMSHIVDRALNRLLGALDGAPIMHDRLVVRVPSFSPVNDEDDQVILADDLADYADHLVDVMTENGRSNDEIGAVVEVAKWLRLVVAVASFAT